LLLALAIGCAGESNAAPPWVSADAGASAPTGDLARAFGNGFHFGCAVAMLDGGNAFGVTINYHMLAKKTLSGTSNADSPLELTQRAGIIEAAPFVRMPLAPKTAPLTPYLKWGFGLEYVTAYVTITAPYYSARPQDSSAQLGLFGGLGVSTPTSHSTGLGVEALFHRIEADTGPADMFSVSLELWAKPKQ
jgi:hypothetical protein